MVVKQMGIIAKEDADVFEYEVNWTLKGNIRKSPGKLKTNSSQLFVDELPQE